MTRAHWIALTITLVACVFPISCSGENPAKSRVTMANFDRVEIGMPYEEVVKIFGKPGVEWTGHGEFTFDKKWARDDGSYVGVGFLNNAVTDKTWVDSKR